MSVLHTYTIPLGRSILYYFRLRNGRLSLRCSGMLCKPFFHHPTLGQNLPLSGVFICTKLWCPGNCVSRQGPQYQTFVTFCQKYHCCSFYRHCIFRHLCLFRAHLWTGDTLSLSLRYDHHKLSASAGWSKRPISFYFTTPKHINRL